MARSDASSVIRLCPFAGIRGIVLRVKPWMMERRMVFGSGIKRRGKYFNLTVSDSKSNLETVRK
jgi:hypothetical protein